MKVVELLAQKQAEWDELDDMIDRMSSPGTWVMKPDAILRFGTLYRSACADLALAESYRLPKELIAYLHQLVARGHNVLYRSESFQVASWWQIIFRDVPARILRDPAVWISFTIFWGLFFGSMLASIRDAEMAQKVIGNQQMTLLDHMYREKLSSNPLERTSMAGYYVFHNAGIGLQCFASGIFFGVGSLVVLAFNAFFLGSVFGYMLCGNNWQNFFEFVTAHSVFELTAVVLSAAAGLRLGWAMIDTDGLTRTESIKRQGKRALEIAAVACILFLAAAYIEGFISPSGSPYWQKLAVAGGSLLVLIGYTAGLGWKGPKGSLA